jgi:hypothetical protein
MACANTKNFHREIKIFIFFVFNFNIMFNLYLL